MRNNFLLICLLFFTFMFSYTVYGKDLELVIKGHRCTDEGIVINYSIVNNRNFNRPNVRIGFKILIDEKPISCRELRLEIPAGADGTDIKEITIKAQCKGKNFKLISTVFGSSISRYKIDNWFSGCP